MKYQRMRWVVHVACMGSGEVHTGFWWGNVKERNHLEDRGVEGRIILKWITRMWDGRIWNVLIWLSIGTGDRQL
jgi:hypothetical protein